MPKIHLEEVRQYLASNGYAPVLTLRKHPKYEHKDKTIMVIHRHGAEMTHQAFALRELKNNLTEYYSRSISFPWLRTYLSVIASGPTGLFAPSAPSLLDLALARR